MKPPTHRLYFLDWVRIIAFFLLIFYHVGMYYVSWDWHVKSPHASDAIEPLMMLSSPWRLGLLFLVSGVASSYLLAKTGASRFVRLRSLRLLLPLLFGMLVIVPPQSYFEVIEKLGYQGSYAQFMTLYVTGYGGFCRGDDCLDLPTWNHLWFVAYLWVYSLTLAGVMALSGPRLDKAAAWVNGWLHGWRLIVLPAAVLALIRAALVSRFPSTHGLFDDWFNHATYLTLFLLGALLARSGAVWQRLEGIRWVALATALCSWALLIIYFSLPERVVLDPAVHHWRVLMRAVYALCAWTAMAAAIGFAHRHLNSDSAARDYLAQAVFPVYIVHQTLIVTIAHLIKPAKVAPAAEGLLLIVLTLCLSFGIFELVRRLAVLRPVFGLPWRASQAQTGTGEKPVAARC